MRYLLHKSQAHELKARQEYLFDIFYLYFLPGKSEGSYIPLIPVGTKGPDVLFITGHTNYVADYMEIYYRQIPEHCIVVTSCLGRTFKKYTFQKQFYVPDLKADYCYLHSGIPYGFGFNISDAELDFYNAQGNIWERLEVAYSKL